MIHYKKAKIESNEQRKIIYKVVKSIEDLQLGI